MFDMIWRLFTCRSQTKEVIIIYQSPLKWFKLIGHCIGWLLICTELDLSRETCKENMERRESERERNGFNYILTWQWSAKWDAHLFICFPFRGLFIFDSLLSKSNWQVDLLINVAGFAFRFRCQARTELTRCTMLEPLGMLHCLPIKMTSPLSPPLPFFLTLPPLLCQYCIYHLGGNRMFYLLFSSQIFDFWRL